MITTDRNRKGRCYDCGQTGIIAAREGNDLLCVACYDSAGDDNSVSDGHMTCDEFQTRWGKHSTYCPGHDYTVVFTKAQYEALTALVQVQCNEAHAAITTLLAQPAAPNAIIRLSDLQDRRASVESIREALWATIVR